MSTIPVERRVFVYEEYPLPFEYMDEHLTEGQLLIAQHVHDLTLRWNEHGDPGFSIMFRSSDGKRYHAELRPPFRKGDQGWEVAIYRNNENGNRVIGSQRFCKREDGTAILVKDVAYVLIAAACILMEAEEEGYP